MAVVSLQQHSPQHIRSNVGTCSCSSMPLQGWNRVLMGL